MEESLLKGPRGVKERVWRNGETMKQVSWYYHETCDMTDRGGDPSLGELPFYCKRKRTVSQTMSHTHNTKITTLTFFTEFVCLFVLESHLLILDVYVSNILYTSYPFRYLCLSSKHQRSPTPSLHTPS